MSPHSPPSLITHSPSLLFSYSVSGKHLQSYRHTHSRRLRPRQTHILVEAQRCLRKSSEKLTYAHTSSCTHLFTVFTHNHTLSLWLTDGCTHPSTQTNTSIHSQCLQLNVQYLHTVDVSVGMRFPRILANPNLVSDPLSKI